MKRQSVTAYGVLHCVTEPRVQGGKSCPFAAFSAINSLLGDVSPTYSNYNFARK